MLNQRAFIHCGPGKWRRVGPVHRALDGEVTERDHAFYTGKVAVAKFFAKNVLPRLSAERKIVEAVDLTAMDLPEEAF